MTVTPPTEWTFGANCDICGVQIPCAVLAGDFARKGDHIVYVITLERTEIEAHLLMHDVVSP